ncbi:helix-turn-helix transcriptional regulator, partial [Vibrio sp. 10N.222.49.E5]|uniref:helix-turn-helix transcriptional regulator n=1 Tax=Vibrio sp. 10N.222.49.E5 TaxID=3229617 RepID=UPI00354CFE4F
ANTDINLQFPRFDTEYKENPDTFVCMEESLDDLTFSEKALPILINKLSKNESKVLEMQMRGVPQQEIADELGVTVRTVFNLRKKIDDKASRVEVD